MNFHKPLHTYSTIFFDCDGVILNSNSIKTDAFYSTARKFYSHSVSTVFRDFHCQNGGVSRYKKFEYLIDNFNADTFVTQEILLGEYESTCYSKLINCEVSEALKLFSLLPNNNTYTVISGGKQSELKEIFSLKLINQYFPGGIYGSPRSKSEIISSLVTQSTYSEPVLFIGDSKYDHIVSTEYDFDFVFISNWTEFTDWQSYCRSYSIPSSPTLLDLFSPYDQR